VSLNLVLDASVLIQAFVQEADTLRVQTLLQGLATDDPDELHIPEFCLLECANVLWKQARFQGMPASHAAQALAQMQSLPLIVHSSVDLLPRALTIGLDQQLAVYDALYIALAVSLALPLVTADERQRLAATASGIPLKPLADFG
jgi:predicted nucleic acid-binding protein